MPSPSQSLPALLGDLRWRINDVRDMLMKEGYNGQRIYGCDEWSTPTINLQLAIDKIDEALSRPPTRSAGRGG